MAVNIYILSACDAWTGTDSMRTLGVTTDEIMLYAMLAAKIKAGDMEYEDLKGEEALHCFKEDFSNGEVNFNKLKYGFVQIYEDMQISEPVSLAAFPEVVSAYEVISGAKAREEIEKLGLDNRSLVYSVVEIRTDSDYISFLVQVSVTVTVWNQMNIFGSSWRILLIRRLMQALILTLLESEKVNILTKMNLQSLSST